MPDLDERLVFPFSIDDPLAAEHGLVSRCLQESVARLPAGGYYRDVELKDSPSGRELLASPPERGRLLVLAAVMQAQFWHANAKILRERASRDERGTNPTQVTGWPQAQRAERKTIVVISALLRRNLPLDRADLLQLLEWLTQRGYAYGLPLGQATKSLERYTAKCESMPSLE